ncbi:MAG: glycosyltransferase [Ramlibacter sp.]|nr:glycosyltransferase [Ramlibacter sp.]
MSSSVFGVSIAGGAVVGFVTAFAAALLLVLTKHLHGSFSIDGTIGVQKFHASPTPRIGGIAVAMGLLAGYAVAPGATQVILGPMLIACVPPLIAGLAEDISKKVGVRTRLFATMSSGVLAWYLTGIAMRNTGIPLVDWALAFTPFAVLFTAFAVCGVTNAINIVDGFNGLAAGAVTIMFGAMGLIALNVGDTDLAAVCVLLTGVTLGFAAVNWPWGKIFLGDGGAYLLGFLLAWIAVLLPMRNPQISGWATLLACAYPILEVGFSYQRKSKRAGYHPGQPDKLHLHMLVYRRITRRACPQGSSLLRNSMTSPFVWALALIPACWAIAFQKDNAMLALGFLFSSMLYWLLYLRLTQFSWCLTPRTARGRSQKAQAPILVEDIEKSADGVYR